MANYVLLRKSILTNGKDTYLSMTDINGWSENIMEAIHYTEIEYAEKIKLLFNDSELIHIKRVLVLQKKD